jgi:hypothetical protein
MRRAARALVETRVETFEVPGAAEGARERVERALADLGAPRALRYRGAWDTADGHTTYVGTFEPSPGTPMLLNLTSVAIVALIAVSAWVVLAAHADSSSRFLLPLLTVLGIIAFPFVIAGFAARREAEESRIARAIRAALADAI